MTELEEKRLLEDIEQIRARVDQLEIENQKIVAEMKEQLSYPDWNYSRAIWQPVAISGALMGSAVVVVKLISQ